MVGQNVHLVLALGGEDPGCRAHGRDYSEADEDAPAREDGDAS